MKTPSVISHTAIYRTIRVPSSSPNSIHSTVQLHASSKLASFVNNRSRLIITRAVTKTPKFHHITPILKSLHWLKINEKIQYKVLSHTYKSLKTGQPSYLRSLLSFPSHHYTRSFSLITLSRPSLTSRLKIANRSYYHSAPVLCNNLPSHLRQVVHHVTPSPISNSPVSNLSTSLSLIGVENPSLSLLLSSLVCIHLGYLRTD